MSAPKCSNFAPPGNRPRHTPQPNQCDLNDTTTSTQRRFVFNQLWSGHCTSRTVPAGVRLYQSNSQTAPCRGNRIQTVRLVPTIADVVAGIVVVFSGPDGRASTCENCCRYRRWPRCRLSFRLTNEFEQFRLQLNAECAYGPYEIWPPSRHFLH